MAYGEDGTIDLAVDEWARDHASAVLWIDLEHCMVNTASCLDRVHTFLNVEKSSASDQNENPYSAMVASFCDIDDSLEYITNSVEVAEKLGEMDGKYSSSSSKTAASTEVPIAANSVSTSKENSSSRFSDST